MLYHLLPGTFAKLSSTPWVNDIRGDHIVAYLVLFLVFLVEPVFDLP